MEGEKSKSYEVKPGISLGNFRLGSSVNEVLKLVEENFLPNRPKIDIMYSTKEPLEHSIIIKVDDFGLQFRFEPISQRLLLIEVSDFNSLNLEYESSIFGGRDTSEDSKSILRLYKLFGPTYPGTLDVEFQLYALKYQGLCIMFHIPDEFLELYEDMNELPLELPDGSSPAISRLFIFGGFDVRNPVLPKLIESYSNLVTATIYYSEKKETKIVFCGKANSSFSIGDSVQDVIGEIGLPAAIYFKAGDKMSIHSPQLKKQNEFVNEGTFSNPQQPGVEDRKVPDATSCFKSSDYFYNYFELGIDVLFDSTSHKAKKFVLHTNFPGHSEFSTYKKCNFNLSFEGIYETTLLRSRTSKPVIVTSETTWSDIEFLLGSGGEPMVQDSGAVANPFGATFLYAYNGCIFEVMKNGHIASVTLF